MDSGHTPLTNRSKERCSYSRYQIAQGCRPVIGLPYRSGQQSTAASIDERKREREETEANIESIGEISPLDHRLSLKQLFFAENDLKVVLLQVCLH